MWLNTHFIWYNKHYIYFHKLLYIWLLCSMGNGHYTTCLCMSVPPYIPLTLNVSVAVLGIYLHRFWTFMSPVTNSYCMSQMGRIHKVNTLWTHLQTDVVRQPPSSVSMLGWATITLILWSFCSVRSLVVCKKKCITIL